MFGSLFPIYFPSQLPSRTPLWYKPFHCKFYIEIFHDNGLLINQNCFSWVIPSVSSGSFDWNYITFLHTFPRKHGYGISDPAALIERKRFHYINIIFTFHDPLYTWQDVHVFPHSSFYISLNVRLFLFHSEGLLYSAFGRFLQSG